MYYSEVMCRQKVDTPWSFYRDFTVIKNTKTKNTNAHFAHSLPSWPSASPCQTRRSSSPTSPSPCPASRPRAHWAPQNGRASRATRRSAPECAPRLCPPVELHLYNITFHWLYLNKYIYYIILHSYILRLLYINTFLRLLLYN